MTDHNSNLSVNTDAERVVEFLQNNPNFFIGRDKLLAQISVPHNNGSTISLVEKQLAVLRDSNTELQQRLALLTNTANDNDRTFEKIRRLTLSLLESRNIEQTIETLNDGLNHDFNIEFHHLILFSSQPKNIPARMESKDVTESILGTNLSNSTVFCGSLEEKQTQFLFDKQASVINSLALIPLNFPEQVGILALGSRDKKQFRGNMGRLFLSYIGDVLSRHLAHLIQLST